ncbi:MAG: hypothetical protein NC092_07665, partial [Butyrivibrio sp.]|nr:hypothetical protein [Muribaculum sp.]MCM1552550.1 hypothetical protein [Butyrivibrio sp.]
RTRDFHPLENAHAGQTKGAAPWLHPDYEPQFSTFYLYKRIIFTDIMLYHHPLVFLLQEISLEEH